ncbi:MAG: SxtJ family membrane protein [Betaproteobacteria bacterium]
MKPALPSDRSFGWTITGVFALGALFYPWVLALAALTAAVTLVRSQWLAPFKGAWMKLGELLHRVVSPVILGLIYFGLFTPAGFVMRLAGRDALARRFEPARPTYWVRRDPPGPRDDSFRDMF